MKPQLKLRFLPSLLFLIIAFLVCGVAFKLFFSVNAFGGGDGSVGNPYQITNCADLQSVQSNLSANYIVTNDFSCSGVTEWAPIGDSTGAPFTGVLDGNGKTISDFTNSGSRDYNGVFGAVFGATIKNITVTNVNFSNSFYYIGGLVGEVDSDATHSVTIQNVHVTGSVGGEWDVGGLIGMASGTYTSVTDSSTNVTVTGEEEVGGLIGYSDATVSGCTASGGVTGTAANIGGLVGRAANAISDSSASGAVSGIDNVGGLVGGQVDNALVSMDNCHASGNVHGGSAAGSAGNSTGGLLGESWSSVTNSYAVGNVINENPTANDGFGMGGLIGTAHNLVSRCYATGTVDGYFSAGGLVGAIYNLDHAEAAIVQSYATGNVGGNITSGNRVGGLVGSAIANISNSYAMGNVTGNQDVGGLAGGAGWSSTTVTYSYSKGHVTAVSSSGGLIGLAEGTVSSSYYDSQTSGMSDTGKGTPKTTAQMQTQSTYTSWDFSDIWAINVGTNGGYPYLGGSGVSSNATVTSSVYTVSTGGTSNETITNVTFGTAKATFLANITKGNANQTWNTSNINDTVVSNNTLVVTAEDGVTIVTYAITVNPEQSHIATISSSTYTVSAGGTSNETISGVPLGVAKSTFLANLNKDDANQTWNDAAVDDPVEPGDVLMVTAEDGTTTVSYTVTAPAFTGNGAGTGEDPYEISSCLQLQEMAYHLSASYEIVSDIDCTSLSTWHNGEGFVPIGENSSNPFVGTLDGKGYVVSNITINKPSEASGSNVGLFGDIEGATITDVTIENISITAVQFDRVGGLVGGSGDTSSAANVLSNIHVSGTIVGDEQVGGVVGYFHGANDSIDYSSTNVDVDGTGGVGGLIGQSYSGTSITNSYTTGDITKTTGPATGGLVGYNIGTISHCYSTSNVTSPNLNIGGLVGLNLGPVTESYATGDVVGWYYVGGLVGLSSAQVSNTYALGNVTGRDWVGGNVGRYTSSANMSYSYSMGSVMITEGTYVGGLVGYHEGSGSIVNSYYDTETSGQSDVGKGIPVTTAQIASKATYVNWDFDNIWTIGMNVDTSSNPNPGGSTSVSGQFLGKPFFRTQTVQATAVATASANFDFVNWKDGENVASSNSSYTLNYIPSDGVVSIGSDWTSGIGAGECFIERNLSSAHALPCGTNDAEYVNSNGVHVCAPIISMACAADSASVSTRNLVAGFVTNLPNQTPAALSADITGTIDIYAGKELNITAKYSDGDTASDLDNLYLQMQNPSGTNIEYYATSTGASLDSQTPTNVSGSMYISSATYDIEVGSPTANDIIVTWHIIPNWKWSRSTDIKYGVKASDKKYVESTYSYTSNTFGYENRLTFSGILTAKDANNYSLNSGDWVKPNTGILFSGLRVVYVGTTDVYPNDADFDVQVINSESQTWADTNSSGRDININATAINSTVLEDVHTLSIVNIPADGVDMSGNPTFVIKVDKTGPVINTLTSTTYSNHTSWFTAISGVFNWEISDSESGIQGVWYLLDKSSSTATEYVVSNGMNTNANSVTLSNISNGIWYFHLATKDNCGNITSSAYMFKVDSTALNIPDIVAITGLYNNVWQNVDAGPVISWTNPGSASGDTFYITNDGSIPSTSNYQYSTKVATYDLPDQSNGTTTINVRDLNGAGVYSETRSFIVKYDNTAPTITSLTSTTYPNSNLSYSSTTGSFNWQISDENSGVSETWYLLDHERTTSNDVILANGISTQENNVTLANIANGTWYLHIVVKDNSENSTSSVYQFIVGNESISVDTTSINSDKPVVKAINTITSAVSSAASNLVSNSQQIAKDIPISDQAAQNITSATLAVIAVTPVVSVGLGSSYTIVSIMRMFSGLLVFFRIGRKKRNCGLVYDSVTKEPINNAIVRFYDSNSILVATEVTNVYGIFETNLKDGVYHIKVQASMYKFPTSLPLGQKDYPYENVYTGGEFAYSSSAATNFSIPMDHIDKGLKEYAGALTKNKLAELMSMGSVFCVIFGFVFSAISYLRISTLLNFSILIVYAVLIFASIVIGRQEKYKFGIVKDSSGNLMQGCSIGLMETEFNTLLSKRVTNDEGKYRFIVPEGGYRLVSLDSGYDIVSAQGLDVSVKKGKIASISKNLVVDKKV